MTEILDEEILGNENFKNIKKLKRFKSFTVKRHSSLLAYVLVIKANSRIIEKTLYERDLVYENVRGETLNRILKESYDALIDTNV